MLASMASTTATCPRGGHSWSSPSDLRDGYRYCVKCAARRCAEESAHVWQESDKGYLACGKCDAWSTPLTDFYSVRDTWQKQGWHWHCAVLEWNTGNHDERYKPEAIGRVRDRPAYIARTPDEVASWIGERVTALTAKSGNPAEYDYDLYRANASQSAWGVNKIVKVSDTVIADVIALVAHGCRQHQR
mgnify:CR=1 FL=1